jgi:uncharacterized membrane protein
MLAVRFYDVVTAVHVLAVVAGFGALFALPVLAAFLRREHPEALAGFYAGTGRLGSKVLTPIWVVALVAGMYLATDADLWSEVWVTIPFIILVALFGIAGAVFAPTERKLAAAAASPRGASSAEAQALASKLQTAYLLSAALVAVAVFLMVTKPGA